MYVLYVINAVISPYHSIVSLYQLRVRQAQPDLPELMENNYLT